MSRINKEYRVESVIYFQRGIFSVYGQICGHRILGLFPNDKKFNIS